MEFVFAGLVVLVACVVAAAFVLAATMIREERDWMIKPLIWWPLSTALFFLLWTVALGYEVSHRARVWLSKLDAG